MIKDPLYEHRFVILKTAVINCKQYIYKIKLTNWFLLILKENLAITAIHICHVNCVAICPVEFP